MIFKYAVSKGRMRRVRTIEGSRYFGLPIGSLITPAAIYAAKRRDTQNQLEAMLSREDAAPEPSAPGSAVAVRGQGLTREYVSAPDHHGMEGMEERARRQKELQRLRREAMRPKAPSFDDDAMAPPNGDDDEDVRRARDSIRRARERQQRIEELSRDALTPARQQVYDQARAQGHDHAEAIRQANEWTGATTGRRRAAKKTAARRRAPQSAGWFIQTDSSGGYPIAGPYSSEAEANAVINGNPELRDDAYAREYSDAELDELPDQYERENLAGTMEDLARPEWLPDHRAEDARHEEREADTGISHWSENTRLAAYSMYAQAGGNLTYDDWAEAQFNVEIQRVVNAELLRMREDPSATVMTQQEADDWNEWVATEQHTGEPGEIQAWLARYRAWNNAHDNADLQGYMELLWSPGGGPAGQHRDPREPEWYDGPPLPSWTYDDMPDELIAGPAYNFEEQVTQGIGAVMSMGESPYISLMDAFDELFNDDGEFIGWDVYRANYEDESRLGEALSEMATWMEDHTSLFWHEGELYLSRHDERYEAAWEASHEYDHITGHRPGQERGEPPGLEGRFIPQPGRPAKKAVAPRRPPEPDPGALTWEEREEMVVGTTTNQVQWNYWNETHPDLTDREMYDKVISQEALDTDEFWDWHRQKYVGDVHRRGEQDWNQQPWDDDYMAPTDDENARFLSGLTPFQRGQFKRLSREQKLDYLYWRGRQKSHEDAFKNAKEGRQRDSEPEPDKPKSTLPGPMGLVTDINPSALREWEQEAGRTRSPEEDATMARHPAMQNRKKTPEQQHANTQQIRGRIRKVGTVRDLNILSALVTHYRSNGTISSFQADALMRLIQNKREKLNRGRDDNMAPPLDDHNGAVEWAKSVRLRVIRAKTKHDLQKIVEEGVAMGFNETHIKAAINRIVRRMKGNGQ